MSDVTPTAPTVTPAATGAVAGADIAQVIAQAVAAAVTASTNEITAKMNQLMDSVAEHVKKISVTEDSNFETSIQGAYDPFDDLRRTNVSRDRIAVYAEQALAHCVEAAAGLMGRSLDHFGSLPPVSAKPQGC